MKIRVRSSVQIVAIGFVVACAALLPACNTVKGVGTDIQKTGEAGERVIDKATTK